MANMQEVLRQLREDEARRAAPAVVAAQRRKFNAIGGAMLEAAAHALGDYGDYSAQEETPTRPYSRNDGSYNL